MGLLVAGVGTGAAKRPGRAERVALVGVPGGRLLGVVLRRVVRDDSLLFAAACALMRASSSSSPLLRDGVIGELTAVRGTRLAVTGVAGTAACIGQASAASMLLRVLRRPEAGVAEAGGDALSVGFAATAGVDGAFGVLAVATCLGAGLGVAFADASCFTADALFCPLPGGSRPRRPAVAGV